MIPYYAPPALHLGPLTLEVFGLFVAAGVLLAARVLVRESRRDGLDPRPLEDYAPWGVGVGVVMGHWVHLFAYHPEELQKSAFQIFKVWDGLSSYGGLLGGILAAAVFFRVRKLSFRAYADVFAVAVVLGWAVARLGCFAVHDHPGVPTDFFLAVRFPGGPRHDLGLYDALWLFAMSAVLFTLRRKGLLRGRLLGVAALLYAPARFFFDSLRATDLSYVDKRYAGLTPAQYACVALFLFGLYAVARWRPVTPPAAAAQAPRARPAR